jgi:thiol-disulfide isomerase/thioredoxin
MSSQEQELNKNEDFGGRKRRQKHHTEKKHSKKNTVVVGKVYADWCGHCQSLKPEWAKMKKRVYSKKGRKHVIFVEIEEKQIGQKMQKIEKEHGVKIEANGYPTLFKIDNGKVDYYNGNRQSDAMSDWYLRGGDGDGTRLPELMQDQQGGTYRKKRRHGNSTFRQYPNTRKFRHSNFTRRMYPRKQQTPKKSAGIFDFLFGK